MIVTTNEIEDVKFSSPELLSSNIKEQYIALIEQKAELKEQIYFHQNDIRQLEKQVKEVESKLSLLQPMIQEVVYKTIEKEEIHNECNLAIINDSDYRNKH